MHTCINVCHQLICYIIRLAVFHYTGLPKVYNTELNCLSNSVSGVLIYNSNTWEFEFALSKSFFISYFFVLISSILQYEWFGCDIGICFVFLSQTYTC